MSARALPFRSRPDVVCLSHLRWDFVFQRPNHLMRACSQWYRTYFVEEPEPVEGASHVSVREVLPGLHVVTPKLNQALDRAARLETERRLLTDLFTSHGVRDPILWFYTPMALEFARELPARLVVYDVMDELSAFRFAPPELRELERELLQRADLVFTGGSSLFEAKRHAHASVHLFPSSVDTAHYAAARAAQADPADQANIPHPRLGFFGVIDERLDLELIAEVARERPDFQIVLVGPVVKIDPATLPRLPNIHYLGQKNYDDLPQYLAGWDVAIMPFALNESTRFISPTKTLEYLAGGKPVVSTPINDVVHPYGDRGFVAIAERDSFGATVERQLRGDAQKSRSEVDELLADLSWNETWVRMASLMERALQCGEREDAVEM